MDVATKLIQDIESLENSIAKFNERFSTDKTLFNDDIQKKIQSLCNVLHLFQRTWMRNHTNNGSLVVPEGCVEPETNILKLSSPVTNVLDSKSEIQSQAEPSSPNKLFPIIDEYLIKNLRLRNDLSELAVILNLDDAYDCLICRIVLQERDLLIHINGKRHIANMADPTSATALKAFHDIFNSVDQISKINKYASYPVSKSQIECHVCSTVININNLAKHFANTTHITSRDFKGLIKYWETWLKRNNISSCAALNEYKHIINQIRSSSDSDKKGANSKSKRERVIQQQTISSAVKSSTINKVLDTKTKPPSNTHNILKLQNPQTVVKEMSPRRKQAASNIRRIRHEIKKKKNQNKIAIDEKVDFGKGISNENKSTLSNIVEILKTKYPEFIIKQMSPSHKEHAANEIQKEIYERRLEHISSEDKLKITQTGNSTSDTSIKVGAAKVSAKSKRKKMQFPGHIIKEMNSLYHKNSSIVIPGIKYDSCLICRITIFKGNKNIIDHLKGSRHKEELKNKEKLALIEPFLKFCDSVIKSDKDDFFAMNKYLVYPEAENSVYCKACCSVVRIDNEHNFLQHLSSRTHTMTDAYSVLKAFYDNKNYVESKLNNFSSMKNRIKPCSPSEILIDGLIPKSSPITLEQEITLHKKESSKSHAVKLTQGLDIEDKNTLPHKRKLAEGIDNVNSASMALGTCVTSATLTELLSGLEKSKTNSSSVNNSPENTLQFTEISGSNISENAIEPVLEGADESKRKTNKKIKCNDREDVSNPIDIKDTPSTLLDDENDSAMWQEVKDYDIYNRLFFIHEHSTYICNLCQEKVELTENVKAICKHIESDKHKTNIANVVISHRFYCHPCNFLFCDDLWYESHKNSSWHKKRLVAFCEVNHGEAMFKEVCCRQCGVLTFGDPSLLPKHHHATYHISDKINAEILCVACNKIYNFSRGYNLIHLYACESSILERFTTHLEELIDCGEVEFEFVGNKKVEQRGVLMTEMNLAEKDSSGDEFVLCHIGIEPLKSFKQSQYKKLKRNIPERHAHMESSIFECNMGTHNIEIMSLNNIGAMQNHISLNGLGKASVGISNSNIEFGCSDEVGLLTERNTLPENNVKSCNITIPQDRYPKPMETETSTYNSELLTSQIPNIVTNLDKSFLKINDERQKNEFLLRVKAKEASDPGLLMLENTCDTHLTSDDVIFIMKSVESSICDQISTMSSSNLEVKTEMYSAETLKHNFTEHIVQDIISETLELSKENCSSTQKIGTSVPQISPHILERTRDMNLNNENVNPSTISDDIIKSLNNAICDNIPNKDNNSPNAEVNVDSSCGEALENNCTENAVQNINCTSSGKDTIEPSKVDHSNIKKKTKKASVAVIELSFDELWDYVSPDEMLQKALFEFDGNTFTCKLCDICFYGPLTIKFLNSLKEHIRGKPHKKKLIEYFEPRFLCDLCDITKPIMGQHETHQLSKDHQDRLKVYSENNSDLNLKPFISECTECYVTTVVHKTFNGHEHTPFELSRDQPKKPNLQKLKKSEQKRNSRIRRITEFLENEKRLCIIVDNMLNTAWRITNNPKDLNACIALKQAVSGLYPNCRAYPFGSRASGLATSFNTDLDVFLDTGGMYGGAIAQDGMSQEQLVNACYDILKKAGRWTRLKPITKARTPILQAFNSEYNVDCDISFRHGLCVENTILLKTLLHDQPIARSMILVLKSWAKIADLFFFGGYTVCYLVIFYLQTKSLLPPIWNIMQNHFEGKKIICGWECQMDYGVSSPRTTEKLVSLLRGLFEFYANTFDFENHVISPLLGQPVIKKLFEDPDTLPRELDQYKEHVKRIPEGVLDDPNSRISKWVMDHPSKEVFRHDTPMCIQDVFDLSHNLTKALTKQNLERFKECCDISAKIIGRK